MLQARETSEIMMQVAVPSSLSLSVSLSGHRRFEIAHPRHSRGVAAYVYAASSDLRAPEQRICHRVVIFGAFVALRKKHRLAVGSFLLSCITFLSFRYT